MQQSNWCTRNLAIFGMPELKNKIARGQVYSTFAARVITTILSIRLSLKQYFQALYMLEKMPMKILCNLSHQKAYLQESKEKNSLMENKRNIENNLDGAAATAETENNAAAGATTEPSKSELINPLSTNYVIQANSGAIKKVPKAAGKDEAWKITSYQVNQRWAANTSALIQTCGEVLLVKDKKYQCKNLSDLEQCVSKNRTLLCPTNWTNLHPQRSCESRLLENSVTNPLTHCSIQIINNTKNSLLEFTTQTAFEKMLFFSMNTTLTMGCNSQKQMTSATQVGIAHISPSCNVTTSEEIVKISTIDPPIIPNFRLELDTFTSQLSFNECSTFSNKMEGGSLSLTTSLCQTEKIIIQPMTIIASCGAVVAILITFLILIIIVKKLKLKYNYERVTYKKMKIGRPDHVIVEWSRKLDTNGIYDLVPKQN
ncbi:unnamed protein product [Trichogramma brassicae]|uniref:Uncharacterized protein n=1 Tax=Trichogramma brassicae TaxID=86971 RepID=A0A6H5HW51_9HYME|nr:unnamed protein product [Trichogramma brassicae]